MRRRTKFPPRSSTGLAGHIDRLRDFRAQEVIFVHEYLTDLDAVGAAIKAKYTTIRATKQDQERAALAVLSSPRVQEYLAEAIEQRVQRTKVTADRVITELSRIAFFDAGQLYNQDGQLRRPDELPVGVRAAISEVDVKVSKDGAATVKYKTYDKLQALKTIMTHLGLLAPERASALSVQYNNCTVVKGNGNSVQVNDNKLDLGSLSTEELRVLRKMMATDENPCGIDECVTDLLALEEGYYADSY